jgi:hypothetical protein
MPSTPIVVDIEKINKSRIKAGTLTLLLAGISILFIFISLALVQSFIQYSGYNPLAMFWVHAFFYLFVFCAFIYWFELHSLKESRLVFLAFLGAGLVFLLSDLDSMTRSLIESSIKYSGFILAIIGYSILLLIWIFWIVYLGMGWPGKKYVSSKRHSRRSMQRVSEKEMIQSPTKTILTPAPTPVSTPNSSSVVVVEPVTTKTIRTYSVVGRAKALYRYSANAEDPAEISFDKGEEMDILDNRASLFF